MKTLTTLLSSLVLAFGLLTGPSLLAQCRYSEVGEKHDIVETAQNTDGFSTLVAALKAADLVGALQGDGPFTVFAPTDEAFGNLPTGTLDSLLKPENKEKLTSILLYHVVPGRVKAKHLAKLPRTETLNGQHLTVNTSKGVRVDEARVIKANIKCQNGIIHVIDRVVLPSTNDVLATAEAAGSFKTLLAAIEAAGLRKALLGDGPFTVFAPTDEAFAALPEGELESLLKPENRQKLKTILTYHVIPGRVFSDDARAAGKAQTLADKALRFKTRKKGHILVNGKRILKADIQATNGVIHVVDAVLLPESEKVSDRRPF